MNDFFGDPDEQEFERDHIGRFVEGNQFWKRRRFNAGNPMSFSDPEKFQDAAEEYFDWVESTPLKLHKVFGSGVNGYELKARAMSVMSLSVFLGISHTTFLNYKKREDAIGEAANYISRVMDAYNVEIACSGLGNGNIIGRLMGLSEKVLHGNDPDNPLPAAETVIQYQLPSNGRD